MANEYDYGSYDSYSQDPEFQRLQAQFSGAFGGSFPTFSYEAWLSDPNYRTRIYEQAGRSPARSPVLQEILDYFKKKTEGSTFEQSGGSIDVAGIFNPLKDELSKLTEQQIRLGRADISQGAERARKYATEGLAGTGLGRSGVAAQTFQGIETKAADQQQQLSEGARLRETQGRMAIDQQIAQLSYQEELRKRSINEQDIQGATDFYRQLYALQYKSMLEQAAQDEGGSWWDTWGPVFEIAAGVGLSFVPGGQAAGASLIAGGASQYAT